MASAMSHASRRARCASAPAARRTRSRLALALALVTAAPWACAAPRAVGVARPGGRVALTVVTSGDARRTAALRSALAEHNTEGLELRFADPPGGVSPAVDEPASARALEGDLARRLSTARARYDNADFAECERAVAGVSLVSDLLSAGRRELAARVLFWRFACHPIPLERAEALVEARAFAALDLAYPPDLGAANAEVQRLFDDAVRAAREAPSARLEVDADAPGTLAVDGRDERRAAPGTLELLPGDHVLRVESEGHRAGVQVVHLPPGGVRVRFALPPAEPELAARQWSARYAGTPAAESLPAVRLLARATRSPRLLYLVVDVSPGVSLLRATLLDGEAPRYAQREARGEAGVGAGGRALLDDLLVSSGLLVRRAVPVWREPAFWVVTGVALVALTGLGVAGYLLTPPRIEVRP